MIKLFSEIEDKCPTNLCKNLLNKLKDTNFITDPASSNYHHNYRHGLIMHSYEMYNELKSLVESNKLDYDLETLFLISFGHDLDKIGTYEYLENDKYKFKLTFKGKMTHGEHSFHRLKKYLGDEFLSHRNFDIIRICILGHMGDMDRTKKAKQFYNDNVDENPLLWLTHMADLKSCELNGSNYLNLLEE